MRTSLAKSKGAVITLIGMLVMTALIVIKLLQPTSLFSGYALIVGIVCFFVVEAMDKTPDKDSGLRFKTFLADLKKPQALLWVLLPVCFTVVLFVGGRLFFAAQFRAYVEHVIGRTGLEMDFTNLVSWILIDIVSVLGEEIAFRGFLVGKVGKVLPKGVCMPVSAVLFSLAHLAAGPAAIVAFDLFMILVDAVCYAFAFQKSGNCLVSFVPHYLNNFLGLLLVRLLFS